RTTLSPDAARPVTRYCATSGAGAPVRSPFRCFPSRSTHRARGGRYPMQHRMSWFARPSLGTGPQRHGQAAMHSVAALVALITLLVVPVHSALAQSGEISGTIVSESSQRPIAGVQVVVEGQTGTGTVTDASGHFHLSGVTGAQVTLNARMLGFRPASQTVRVGATDVRFALADRPVELNQVVVTGTAGGQQQRALGNSVAKVNAAEVVANAPIPSVESLINGRAPGVTVMPGTGMIGAGANIRIRGVSTFSLSGDPLIYVDGVRVDNQTGTG